MRINSIIIKNYRPFRLLEETSIGNLTTLVGRNDSGKSSILRALKLFFNDKAKVEEDDI
ncbi:MAG: AAA family ATPase, partial [Candidatus Helarchaeota archaeon]